MRHFYKLLQGQVNLPLMTEIMRNQAELFDENGWSKELPVEAKRMALAIMQVTNGTALNNAMIERVEHVCLQFEILPFSHGDGLS